MINERIGIVTMEGLEIPGDAEDHCGVFFGTFEDGQPEVWIIPADLLSAGPAIVLKH